MQSWNAVFFLFLVGYSLGGGGGISGRVRALNLTVPLGSGRVGSGQTISGTGRVRASVLSPCRPLVHRGGWYGKNVFQVGLWSFYHSSFSSWINQDWISSRAGWYGPQKKSLIFFIKKSNLRFNVFFLVGVLVLPRSSPFRRAQHLSYSAAWLCLRRCSKLVVRTTVC